MLWNAPTVKVTGTNPAPSTSFSKNIDGRGGTNLTAVSVKNYYEDYYACVYEKVSSALGMATGYTLSEITLKLEGAGSALSSSNNAKITLKNSSTNERSYDNVFTFTNSQSQTGKVGGMDRNSRVLLGKATVTTIDMTYEGNVFTLNLSHDLEIKGPNLLNPTLSFDIPAEHAWLVSDLNLTNNPNPSGRDISFTAPATITKKGMDTKQVGEAQLVGYKVETKTQPIKWTEGSGCSSSDKKGSKVTTVRTPVYQGTFAEVERTFTIAKWSVTTTTRSHTTNTSSATINAGATRNFTGGDNVITPVVTYVDGAMGEEYESTEYGDEEDPVVTWPNGEPGSNWSNDGNATTATTYTDASGKTISKPAGWPAG